MKIGKANRLISERKTISKIMKLKPKKNHSQKFGVKLKKLMTLL